MTDRPSTVPPDKRAKDLALHLLACTDLEIIRTEMRTWMAKAHFIETDAGQEHMLLMGGQGDYVLYGKDAPGAFETVMESGHIDQTPAGKPALQASARVAYQFTGQDLNPKERIDFSGLGSGLHMVPKEQLEDHSFMLIEIPPKTYSMIRGDNPSEGVPDFEEVPFATATEAELARPDAAFTVRLDITDEEMFRHEMGGVALENLTSPDLVANLLRPGDDLPVEVLDGITCSEIEWDGQSLSMKVKAQVGDRGALVAAARGCYEACWGDRNWYPGSASEALYELLLASNANPSPDEMGFAITDTAFMCDPEEQPPTDTPEP